MEMSLESMIQDLIGCAWGRDVWLDDDPTPCPEQAASITVIHDQDKQIQLKLCPKHKSRILEETAEHEDEPDAIAVVILECEGCGLGVACLLGAEPPTACAQHSA